MNMNMNSSSSYVHPHFDRYIIPGNNIMTKYDLKKIRRCIKKPSKEPNVLEVPNSKDAIIATLLYAQALSADDALARFAVAKLVAAIFMAAIGQTYIVGTYSHPDLLAAWCDWKKNPVPHDTYPYYLWNAHLYVLNRGDSGSSSSSSSSRLDDLVPGPPAGLPYVVVVDGNSGSGSSDSGDDNGSLFGLIGDIVVGIFS